MNGLFTGVDKFIDIAVKPAVVILGLLIAGAFVLGIFVRSVLGVAIFGLEELILIAVVWFYMLGGLLASKDRSHLCADFIPLLIKSDFLVAVFKVIATLVSIVTAIFFVWWGYDLLMWGVKKNPVTAVFSIPYYVSQSSLFFAGILFVVYLIRDLVDDINCLLELRRVPANAKISVEGI